jgi:hypothetical protein
MARNPTPNRPQAVDSERLFRGCLFADPIASTPQSGGSGQAGAFNGCRALGGNLIAHSQSCWYVADAVRLWEQVIEISGDFAVGGQRGDDALQLTASEGGDVEIHAAG